jgi:hypothetical protein
MKPFLGVPILLRGVAYGNLYLTEKAGGGDFTQEDAEVYEHRERPRSAIRTRPKLALTAVAGACPGEGAVVLPHSAHQLQRGHE